MRSTDRQRQRAISRLHAAYVEGALSTGTFEARALSALDGRTTSDLSRLLDDIPTRVTRLLGRLEAFFWPEDGTRDEIHVTDVSLSRRVGETVIGRDPRCDVVLTHPSVSRRHLRISFDGEHWTVQDLRSTNGTLLNGRRCRVAAAHPGDRIRLGDVAVRIL